MKRQLDDYYSKFYNKQAKRFHHLMEDDAKAARTLASWKEQVAARWNEIEVVSVERDENVVNGNIEVGKNYSISMVIDEKGLNDAVGVELVTLTTDNSGNDVIYSVEPMEMVKQEGNLFTFNINYSLNNAGAFKVCYRIYPKHEELPHRQDFAFVKWMA